jgi:Zn-dependent protease
MPEESAGVGVSIVACPDCGTRVPSALNACPNCHRLLHGEQLQILAREAERATREGDLPAALAAWRSALELLPPDSRQHQSIQGRISALARQVDAPPSPASAPSPSPGGTAGDPAPGWGGKAGATGVGALALALWKFKFVAFLVLSKAKLLMLGLTKASTFYSMFLSIGVYALAWGWKFALGFVISIYVHEMGHVAALMRYGIKASAPMFIPGLGALVRLKQPLYDPRQEARVALAGPAWGLGAALAAYAVFLATGFAYWAALAKVGALINLFNLLPFWQLDGGRAFHALTRPQRWLAACAVATMWAITSDGMTFLIMLVAASQAAFGKPARVSDRYATLLYVALFVSLSALTMIPVPA